MGKLTTAQARSLEQHEQTIEQGMASFMAVGRALLAIREDKLYKATHDDFERYCRGRWNMGRNYANKLIDAVEAADDVSEVETKMGTIVPTNEAVSREIAKIPSIPQRADVWAKVVETAPVNKESGEPIITAAHTAKTREAVLSNGHPVSESEAVDEPEPELWETFAEKHNEALNHLTAAMKAITWIEKHEADAAYLAPVITRIRTDYKQLRGTISQNCPTGVKGGEIQTKVMERK